MKTKIIRDYTKFKDAIKRQILLMKEPYFSGEISGNDINVKYSYCNGLIKDLKINNLNLNVLKQVLEEGNFIQNKYNKEKRVINK